MQSSPAIKALGIVHKAMMAGQLLFAACCIFLYTSGSITVIAPEMDRPLQIAAVLLAAVGFFASTAIFKKRMQAARDGGGTAKEKFESYRAACLLQWALLEGPGLFCIIAFFLTGNYAFLALTGLLVLLMAMTGPSKEKIQLQLGLSEQEISEL